MIALLTLALALPLQEGGTTLLEGHSAHGEAFNEGPRQAAYLFDGNPESVHFPVSVEGDDLQRLFDQGVGHLHGFWYFEAERTFRQIAAEDPDCAMAYWGMAMANVDNAERAKGFARAAWLKRGLVTKRERMYIDAVARFHGVEGPEEPEEPDEESAEDAPDAYAGDVADEDDCDWTPPRTRKQIKADEAADKKAREEKKKRAAQLVKDYEEIVWEYPDDIEAKAFLVNRLWLNKRFGLPISSRQANEALLADIFTAQPMHPAHHYRIHLWDAEDSAERIVDTATKSGPSWPNIAHMWHMAGHVFERLGRHGDSAWQQEASARVDHKNLLRDRVLPDQIHNFAHNNEWLSRSLRHTGRVHESLRISKNMIEMPRHPRFNTLEAWGGSAWWGRRRLIETLEQYELWDQLAELADTMYLEPCEDDGQRDFALGKAHAWRRDHEGFEAARASLVARLDAKKAERAKDLDRTEEAAVAADFEREDLRAALDAVLDRHAGDLTALRSKLRSLDALRGVLENEDVEEGLETLEKERYDTSQLALLHLHSGKPDKAVELARKGIEKRDGELYPHATLAHVLFDTGEWDEALEVFEEVRTWCARADLDIPVLKRLAPLARRMDLERDWRPAFEMPADVAAARAQLDLASLGPAYWTPPPAPDWTAPDAFGDEVSLSDYRGEPVLVIFFLGFGCVHCIEQLHAFAPEYDAYRAAGIEIVTIGTNSVEQLAKSFGDDPDDTGYPFRVLANPELDLFRLYRAYDDFEEQPLHGTFLIDGAGRVRWQDISYEPFMDTDFLLAESQRLLGLPEPKAPGAPVAGRPTSAAGDAR